MSILSLSHSLSSSLQTPSTFLSLRSLSYLLLKSIVTALYFQILFSTVTQAGIKSVKPLRFKNPGIKHSLRRPSSEDRLKTHKPYQLKLKNFQVEGFGEQSHKKTLLKQSN